MRRAIRACLQVNLRVEEYVCAHSKLHEYGNTVERLRDVTVLLSLRYGSSRFAIEGLTISDSQKPIPRQHSHKGLL